MSTKIRIKGEYPGSIVINNMVFTQIIEQRVSKSNDTSGKVNVPAEFIGRDVYVCIPDLKRTKKRSSVRN